MLILNEAVSDPRVMRAAGTLSGLYDLHVVGWLRPERAETFDGRHVEDLPFRLHLIDLWSARHLPKNAFGYAARYLESCVRFVRTVRKLRPSVIHAHEVDTLLAGWAIAKLTGAMLIYDAHELYRDQLKARGKCFIRCLSGFETFLMRRCDAIVACNRQRADIMREEYGAPFAPDVVRNLPPFSRPVSNGKLREYVAQRNPDVRHLVVHPGGILGRGEDVLLDALAETPSSIALVLIGYSENNISATVRRKLKEKKLENRFFLYPRVPYADLLDYVCSGDLGLVMYPNTNRNNYFCASNKIYEYAMCGLPVVAVDFPPCRDILNKYAFGLCFQWDDPRSLAEAIVACLKDAGEYQAMVVEAHRAAHNENWGVEQKHLIGIYERLCGKDAAL